MTDTCARPAEGWTNEPDRYGHLKYTMYGRISESAPELPGWEPFFVAVHGANYTTWTYRSACKGFVGDNAWGECSYCGLPLEKHEPTSVQ